MIDVQPTNNKLKDRAARIVSEIADVDYETAKNNLIKANYNVKTATIMIKANLSPEKAQELLLKNNGRLREILQGL
ncbi:MAG: hypothetical protein MZV64_26795 [Ignavibacteriales bacterium]|nr:hypothetical protein [Ignavibacteriales bacterium]